MMMRACGVLVALFLQAAGALPVRTLDRGAQSGIQTTRREVVRTATVWNALWAAHASGRPAPEVDFSRDMVVAMFAGSRPSAGYSIEIVSVERENGALTVKFRESAPPSDAMVAEVLTSPFHLAVVQRAQGQARFERLPD